MSSLFDVIVKSDCRAAKSLAPLCFKTGAPRNDMVSVALRRHSVIANWFSRHCERSEAISLSQEALLNQIATSQKALPRYVLKRGLLAMTWLVSHCAGTPSLQAGFHVIASEAKQSPYRKKHC